MADAQTQREIAEEHTAAARFERLAGIVRRILWNEDMTPAMQSAQTLHAMVDLFEWSFADAIDRASECAVRQEQRR